MNHSFFPYCSDTEKRNQVEESYRNIEKCAVCGKERYGHRGHKFKGSWKDVDITDAQDILKEIKKSRGDIG